MSQLMTKSTKWSESSLGAHPLCWFCHVAAHILYDTHPCVKSFEIRAAAGYNIITNAFSSMYDRTVPYYPFHLKCSNSLFETIPSEANYCILCTEIGMWALILTKWHAHAPNGIFYRVSTHCYFSVILYSEYINLFLIIKKLIWIHYLDKIFNFVVCCNVWRKKKEPGHE